MTSSASLTYRSRGCRFIFRWLGRLGNVRWGWMWAALLVLAFSFVLHLFLRHPVPRIHDEFSYLLQADTFAHGRLSNPQHPMWQHFETFHVVNNPFYASKYPPAQGVFIAAGQVLWRPILGVWVSTALAIAAVFWMLKGFFPARWAVIGTLLAFCNPEVLSWNWSYWGGSLSLLGGALIIGGCWRMRTLFHGARNSAMAGVGMALLALSRPFEGLVLSAVIVGLFCLRRRPSREARGAADGGSIVSLFLPMILCGTVGVLIFAAYNYRVTGHPLRMAYTIYEKSYATTPLFFWQKREASTPSYRHDAIRRYYANDAEQFDKLKTVPGYVSNFAEKLKRYRALVWNGWLIVLIIPMGIAVIRNRRAQLIFAALSLFLFVTWGVSVYANPHYSAAAYPLLIVLSVFGLRIVHAWRSKGKHFGRLLAILLLLSMCIASVDAFIAKHIERYHDWSYRKAAMLETLQRGGEKYLVIVQYDEGHSFHAEWVYNEADIDNAKVVWARDMGEGQNRRLREYFKDRHVIEFNPRWTLKEQAAHGYIRGKVPVPKR